MKASVVWKKVEEEEEEDEGVGWRTEEEEAVGSTAGCSASFLPHLRPLCRTRGGVFVQCSDESHEW